MAELSLCYIMSIFSSLLSYFVSYAFEHPMVMLVLSFCMAVLLMSNVHLSKVLCSANNIENSYDYGPEKGPHSWTRPGTNQSPININSCQVEISSIREPLMWNHFNDLPTKVTIENNGHTVIVKATYASNSPTINGADLIHSYTFESVCFRWSFWNTEGSEHSIDCRKYPLELQATHKTQPVMSCIPANEFLVVAYLFEIAAHNQFLDPVVLNLHRIRKPGTVVEISPFPLAWLCYPFRSGFYSYGGSKSDPPCHEGVEWFINSEPMSISESQLTEFRSLMSIDGSSRIVRNARPVQCLTSNRVVTFNQFDVGGICSTHSPNQSEVYETDVGLYSNPSSN